MKKLICTFAAVAMLAAIASVAIADDGMGTLAGTVVSAQAKPVPGASVTVQSADGKSPHATTTNAQGRFFFPELTHGLYDVRANHNGFSSEWKHNVNVETGKQVEVELKLTVQRKGPQ